MPAKKLRLSDVEIDLQILPEDTSPSEFADEDQTREILEQLEHNECAWFCARVTVSFEGLESDPQYLGGCSYGSQADFEGDAYYADMVAEALSDLQTKVDALFLALQA